MSKLVFDESSITIGDLEDFEDAIGISLMTALKAEKVRDDDGKIVRHDNADNCREAGCGDKCENAGRPFEALNLSAKVMKGLVWIVARQSDPEFTLEDARRTRVTELEIVNSADDAPASDPKAETE
jgi:hypothetical protein